MKNLLTIFAVFCFGFSAMAQTEIADGKPLIEAYISPLGNSAEVTFERMKSGESSIQNKNGIFLSSFSIILNSIS